MQRRPLGKTGEELSILGFGGIIVSDLPQEDADRIVAGAVDRGVNYFDVAPTYGNAEDILGPALEPHREKVFLVGKTAERGREASARELETTLRKFHTDRLDLYQLHGMASMEDVETVFGPDGAMETLQAAQRDGKVRFLGLSAHSEEAGVECLRRFAFDTILFPLNFVCWFKGFGQQIYETAKERGTARLALKSVARTWWPDNERKLPKCWYEPYQTREGAEMPFRFTLSQDITAAVAPGQTELFPMMMDMADDFRPISGDEEQKLREIAQDLAPIFPQD
jgi:predicted aldo/keto reductase-like oxidoreductase